MRQLNTNGIERVVMLTGDNERVARAIAKRRGSMNFMRTCFLRTRCV